MPQEITETAKLQCNQGTVTTTLKVTSQQFAKINDKLQATEENLKLIPIYTFLWMERQDKFTLKKSLKDATNPQKPLTLSMAKPIPKKSGKPLNKSHGEKYQANRNHKSFWERLFG